MSDSVKERLEEYLKARRISKAEFGRQVGVSSAYVSSIRSSVSPAVIKNIAAKYPDLSIDWLLTGDGKMLGNSEDFETLIEPDLSDRNESVQFGSSISSFKAQWLKSNIEKLLSNGLTKAEISRRLSILPQQLNNIIHGKQEKSVDIENIDKLWSLLDFQREQLKAKDLQINSLLKIIQELRNEK